MKWYRIEMLFLSFFGLGYFPKAPGTIASIATLPFLYFLGYINCHPILILPFFAVMTILASIVTEYTQKKLQSSDPSWIVIDEVLGITLSWIIFPTDHIPLLLTHLVLFRLFDIFKPGPIGYIDKHIKNGFGVIADDLLSGVFSGLITFTINYFIYT